MARACVCVFVCLCVCSCVRAGVLGWTRAAGTGVVDSRNARRAAGAYELPSLSTEVSKKVQRSRAGVFGSTTKRFFRQLELPAPGPGEYAAVPVPSKRTARLRAKPASVFASATVRLGSTFLGAEDAAASGPAPGSYEVPMAWMKGGYMKHGKREGV